MSGLAAVSIANAAETVATVVFVVAGGVLALAGLYLLLLSVAAFFYRGYRRAEGRTRPPSSRVVVLIPAHNEAVLIARCVQSLRAQRYPADLYDIVVIADNCTDDTAAVASSAGAQVLVRDEPQARGKGRALRWATDRVLARPAPPDAIVVVDADSVAERDFLPTLLQPFEDGAQAVQGESLLAEDGSPATALRAAAFLLINRVRPAGRAVLRLPCGLAGNGMLFSRELLAAVPWDAFSSAEDLEYAVKLRIAGIGPVFAGGATLRTPGAPNPQAAAQQQLRWEGGKLHVVRTQIPRLIAGAFRDRRPALLEAAFDLAVPPLGLLAATAAGGALVGALLIWADLLPAWALLPWLLALVSIPLYVLVGLRAGRAPASAYRSLSRAPLLVVTKALRAPRLFRFRADMWVRTERPDGGADDDRGHPVRDAESGEAR